MKLLESLKVLSIRMRTPSHVTHAQHTCRHIVSFREASRIGLLYEDSDSGRTFSSRFCDHMYLQGKSVAMLGYSRAENTSLKAMSERMTPHSFDLWGRLRSTHVAEFLESHFDYLYHLNLASTALSEYALKLCRAKCRVGFYQSNKQELYDVMVHLQQTTDESANHITQNALDQLLKYTTALEPDMAFQASL